MSEEELKSELERLRNENAALKKGASTGIRMKVSEKGALSIYGMGRFPVTLSVAEAFGYVDRHSCVHCRERSAVEDEGLKKGWCWVIEKSESPNEPLTTTRRVREELYKV